MHTTLDKLKFACAHAREKTENFFYGYFYPVYLALAVLLFWVANLQVVGFAIIIFTACFLLIFYDDFTPILPLIFLAPMSFRTLISGFFTAEIVILAILASLFISALIYHLIKYPIKRPLFDKFFFVCVGLFIVLLFSGLFSGKLKYFSYGLQVLFMAGVVPMLIHFLFLNKINFNTKINLRKYFAFIFITATNVACIEIIYGEINPNAFAFNKHYVPGNFCWANTNHIANLILMAVPLCLYLMRDCKSLFLGALELILLYGSMLVTKSDGALAVLLGYTPAMMIIFYLNAYLKHVKKLNVIYTIILSLGVLVGSYLLLFKLDSMISLFQKASNPIGRLTAYNQAYELFLKHPVYGAGLGGGSYELFHLVDIGKATETYNGFYHSTFFHFLACSGTIGILAFVLYYIARIKLITLNDSVFGVFALISFLMFANYGMIENSEYVICLLYMTSIISFSGIASKKGNGDKPLPLFVKNVFR